MNRSHERSSPPGRSRRPVRGAVIVLAAFGGAMVGNACQTDSAQTARVQEIEGKLNSENPRADVAYAKGFSVKVSGEGDNCVATNPLIVGEKTYAYPKFGGNGKAQIVITEATGLELIKGPDGKSLPHAGEAIGKAAVTYDKSYDDGTAEGFTRDYHLTVDANPGYEPDSFVPNPGLSAEDQQNQLWDFRADLVSRRLGTIVCTQPWQRQG